MVGNSKPPVRAGEREHRVTVTDDSAGIVHCNTCGKGWAVMVGRRGRMPRRWWACPNGCNV